MLRTAGEIEYELVKTSRRNVQFRVGPEGVRVFAPANLPPEEIDRMVLEKEEWILSALNRTGMIAGRRQEEMKRRMQPGGEIMIEGKPYRLHLITKGERGARIWGDELLVYGADGSAELTDQIVHEYLLQLAMERFRDRVRHFGAFIGRSPKRITVRDQKTRWGSCSAKGNLNFNWRLITMPPELLDYVVVHELCHMIEMNHSAAFWDLVRKYMPDYEQRRALLKKQSAR